MSPFAHLLHELRMRFGIRQGDLAELVGYEQSYVSALEVGIKGPPPPAFVNKLISALHLASHDQERLHAAVTASQRKLVIDVDAPQEVYHLVADLHQHLATLHPAQVRMIREVLSMREVLAEPVPEPVRRLKRRKKEEARM
ncbi:helix-turn-helix transcriptional regulator [Aquitalea sp.]|uniref:helix-turn-helix domain-containing protein n=1 Tax=Aquitalea sp. TaxID=1872623 RepID=UPI002589FB26|nr:helix-turn-helix transcriptional regulator [Aquitalea sp.]